MLHYIFGNLQESKVHLLEHDRASGYLEYDHARVRWFLSINIIDVPLLAREKGQRTYRSITVNKKEIDFSGGFKDLHVYSYEKILQETGFGLEENRVAIKTVADIRNSKISRFGEQHPFLIELSK